MVAWPDWRKSMPRGFRPSPWRASVWACVAGALALVGCLERHELRPVLEAREVGEDFVFESAEARDAHPNRYSYEVEDAAFGPLPRIVLEPRIRLAITNNLEQLTEKTDLDGTVNNASGAFGPYVLGEMPTNPKTAVNTVTASTDGATTTGAAGNGLSAFSPCAQFPFKLCLCMT